MSNPGRFSRRTLVRQSALNSFPWKPGGIGGSLLVEVVEGLLASVGLMLWDRANY